LVPENMPPINKALYTPKQEERLFEIAKQIACEVPADKIEPLTLEIRLDEAKQTSGEDLVKSYGDFNALFNKKELLRVPLNVLALGEVVLLGEKHDWQNRPALSNSKYCEFVADHAKKKRQMFADALAYRPDRRGFDKSDLLYLQDDFLVSCLFSSGREMIFATLMGYQRIGHAMTWHELGLLKTSEETLDLSAKIMYDSAQDPYKQRAEIDSFLSLDKR